MTCCFVGMRLSLLLRGKEPNRPDEHQRPVFAHGEIDVERSDHGTANLHAQDRQAIKRLAELVRIVAEAVNDRAQRLQELLAAPFARSASLKFANGFGNQSGEGYLKGPTAIVRRSHDYFFFRLFRLAVSSP